MKRPNRLKTLTEQEARQRIEQEMTDYVENLMRALLAAIKEHGPSLDVFPAIGTMLQSAWLSGMTYGRAQASVPQNVINRMAMEIAEASHMETTGRAQDPPKEGETTGRVNAYHCQSGECGQWTRTILREDGVTPFMIDCPACGVRAYSSFYNLRMAEKQGMPPGEPTHEWYRPAPDSDLARQYPDAYGPEGEQLALRPISSPNEEENHEPNATDIQNDPQGS